MPPRASGQSAGKRDGEAVKHQKWPSKRKQPVQTSAIVQSQDDGGDEVVWKVSPTVERLQSAAAGEPQVHGVAEGRSTLQPCQNFYNKSEAVHEILSKASTCGTSSSKKKKSPGMAGKLELWLSSSREVHLPFTKEEKAEFQDEDKENVPDGRSLNNSEAKRGTTPARLKAGASVSKRPSNSSSRKRRQTTQKIASASFCKGTTKQPGHRRKALLDLLDKVDDALVVRHPTLVQTRLSLNLKLVSSPQKRSSAHEPKKASKLDKLHLGIALPSALGPVSTDSIGSHSLHVPSVVMDQQEPDLCTDDGDHNMKVLNEVKVLDIGSDSKAPVPLVGGFTGPNNDKNGTHMSHSLVKCDPGSDHEQNVGNLCFLVLEVADGEHEEQLNLSYPQKNLRLLDERYGVERIAYLRDTWFHAMVKPGDTVNVIGEFDIDGKCVIDREHNLIVINPDILISGSKVGSSFLCPRRAVLDERIKSNDTSYPALMGTMLHQLFQVALRSEHPSPSSLDSEARLIIRRHLDGLYAVGVSEKEACGKLVMAIPTIICWWQEYVGIKTSAATEIEFGRKHGRQPMFVSEILDIEEMVWSPKYGLKGMIDASVMVKLGKLNLGGQDQIMPLELKTGKATTGQAATEHRAQIILYTLLMSDRYMQNIGAGLLYYLDTNQTQGVEAQHAEVVGLMMRRNDHARNLLEATSNQNLPPMLQNYNMCQGCRQLEICTVYHKAQEQGTGESSGLGELFGRSTDHLSNTHMEFFRKWNCLIDLEGQDSLVSQSAIWRVPSKKREEQGRCISSLLLDISANGWEERKSSARGFTYCFQRGSSYSDQPSPADGSESSGGILQDAPFACGDYVLLSTESGHTAVAGGTITNISKNSVTLRLQHRLRIPRKQQTSSNIASLQEVWRIDKDDKASSLAIMRYNLIQLFVKTNGDEHRRRLIVDLEGASSLGESQRSFNLAGEAIDILVDGSHGTRIDGYLTAPKFEIGAVADSDPSASYLRSASTLNDDQIRAIQRVIAARDYALILGMPGTGKTSTIVHAVIALLARKASVLLTSYTNSAVDNMLLKLKEHGVDFVRVGRSEAIHPDLKDKVLGEGLSVTSVKEFESLVEEAQVVGVTCLGATHALFGKRKFDVCIVDEAGQITLPACIGPLRYARTFVLVGDHYQLPPLVRSAEAREEGMATSLFRRLSEAHPESISVLQCQYRMCSDIMALSNSLIYSNRLRCGSLPVANASLPVPQPPKTLPPWLLQVVDPMRRVLFLDTDDLRAEESCRWNKIHNSAEATILLMIIQALHEGGVDIRKIGVISPYNAQVDHVRKLAANAGYSCLEVHTVDKYQGREKDCVLISFVRSNNQQQILGSLLADWHRINVAVTRAKTKLLMIGSQKTLSSAPIIRHLIQQVAESGGLLQLPPHAITNAAR